MLSHDMNIIRYWYKLHSLYNHEPLAQLLMVQAMRTICLIKYPRSC